MPHPLTELTQALAQRQQGIPTAAQEALQEPAVDPVFVLASMFSGGLGSLWGAQRAAQTGRSLLTRAAGSAPDFASIASALQGLPLLTARDTASAFGQGAVSSLRPNVLSQLLLNYMQPHQTALNKVGSIPVPMGGFLRLMEKTTEEASQF